MLSGQRLTRMSKKGISLSCSNSILNSVDTVVSTVRIPQKLISSVFSVKHGESVIHISVPKRRTNCGVKNPLFLKIAHEDVGQNWA